MSVTAPPRPPRPSGLVERDELEALVEALIEEARRRARRRRLRNGAGVLLAVVAGSGLYFGLAHVGGGTTGAATAVASNGGDSSRVAQPEAGDGDCRTGRKAGPGTTVAVAPSAPETVYLGTGRGVFRSANGGAQLDRRRACAAAPRLTGLVGSGGHGARGRPAGAGHRVCRSERPVGRREVDRWDDLSARRLQDDKRREVLARPRSDRPACRDQSERASDPLRGSRRTRRTAACSEASTADAPGSRLTVAFLRAPSGRSPLTRRRRRPIYAAMGQRGIFKSSDGGARWHAVRVAVSHREVTAIAVDPYQPGHALRRHRQRSDQEPRRRPQLAYGKRSHGRSRARPRLQAGDRAHRRQSQLTHPLCDHRLRRRLQEHRRRPQLGSDERGAQAAVPVVVRPRTRPASSTRHLRGRSGSRRGQERRAAARTGTRRTRDSA